MRRIEVLARLVVLVLAAAAACARPVDFATDPGQVQAVNVINELGQPMIVAFDDGTGERLLGTVASRATERFVLAGVGTPTVSIIARDQEGARTVRRTVALVPGGVVDVRIN
jgi:hypothetical protein